MNDVGRVTYFNGQMPVFVHDTNDIRPFRLITSQFCVNTVGNRRSLGLVLLLVGFVSQKLVDAR